MRRALGVIPLCTCPASSSSSTRGYASVAVAAVPVAPQDTLLDFLYPGFGYFSRALAPERRPPAGLALHFSRPWARTRTTVRLLGPALSRIRTGWSLCSCGRPPQGCLRCRASSSLATAVAADTSPIAAAPPPPTTPKASPQASVPRPSPPPPVDLAALTNIFNVLDKELPSIRVNALARRSLPQLAYVDTIPVARKTRTQWTLELAIKAADSLWTRTAPLRQQRGAGLDDTQQLDFIRLFARFVRAVSPLPNVLPPTDSAQILALEAYKSQLVEFRHTQGERIRKLLDLLPISRGSSHARSLATLQLDSASLCDILPSIPLRAATLAYRPSLRPVIALTIPYPTPPIIQSTFDFDAALITLFGPSADGPTLTPDQHRSRLQSQLTTLSVLLQTWARSPAGPEQALALVHGWELEHLLVDNPSPADAVRPKFDKDHNYKSILRRTYGELVAQLQPSPAAWFDHLMQFQRRNGEVRLLGLHLIPHLALTGQPLQALAVYKTLREYETVFSDKEEVVTVGHLLEGLYRGGFYEDAKHLVSIVSTYVAQTISPGNVHPYRLDTIRTALKVAAQQGNVSRVDGWLARLQAVGYDTGLEGVARQIRARAQENELGHAKRIFEESDQSLASAESRTKLWGELVRAHVRLNDLDGGMAALQSLVDQNLTPPLALINTLLHGYAARLDLSRTYSLFERIPSFQLQPDVVSYSALVTLHSNLRDPESAERTLSELTEAGLEADQHIWTTLMNAHVEVGGWERAMDIFLFLDTHDNLLLRPDIATTNVLIKANVLVAASAQSVLALFRRTLNRGLRPNVQTYTLVMQSLCTAGMMNVAEELFTMMDHPNEPGRMLPTSTAVVKPDGFIFSILLQGYLHTGDTIKARACLVEMRARGIQPSSVTYGIIVGSYLQRNTVVALKSAKSLAQEFLTQSPLKTQRHKRPTSADRPFARGQDLLNVFGPIINAYAKRMDARLAMEYFQQVLHENVQPSIPLYTSMMDAYRGVTQLESVRYLWNHLHALVLDNYPSATPVISSNQFPPTDDPVLRRIDSNHRNLLCLPLSVYIRALAENNAHTEISSTWQQLAAEGFAFDAGNWNSLALALAQDGQLERAFWIAEHVLCEVVEEGDIRRPAPDSLGPFASEGDLIDTTLRTPNRIYQNREQERAVQRRRRTTVSAAIAPTSPMDIDLVSSLLQSRTKRRTHYWFPHSRLVEALELALSKLSPSGGRVISRGQWRSHESDMARKFETQLGVEEAASLRDMLRRGHPRTLASIRHSVTRRARSSEILG